LIKPEFHSFRHVTTRHDTTRYLGHAFWQVLCRACRTARCDTLVTTSATRTRRVQGCRHMPTSLFPEVVPEIDANPEHKRHLHASTTASSPTAM